MTTARDPAADPRWWDQNDAGWKLLYRYGTPAELDLVDVYVAALEGDPDAQLFTPDPLADLRAAIDKARAGQSKYEQPPHA